MDRRGFLRDSGALGVVLLGCRGGTVGTGRTSPAPDGTGTIDRLRDEIPRVMASGRIPGLSIALVEAGDTTWTEGFGFMDRERRAAVTPETLFFVGSITKSITALGVLVAVNRGLLSLDAPIVEYLPWFEVDSSSRGDGRRITVRHLLSHHSGLATWAPVGNPYDGEYHSRTFEEVVRSSRGQRLKFGPGERFEYSNQGIDLAGFVLEQVTRTPIADVLRDFVLRPLGMASSTLDPAEVERNGRVATPYAGTRAVAVRRGVLHPLRAAGGLASNAVDLARFVSFHLRGTLADGTPLVDPSLLRQMYTPQFSASALSAGYGLGIYNATEWGTTRFSHGGFGYGVSTHYRWLPEHALGVVVLTNQGAAHNGPRVASRATQLLLSARRGESTAARSGDVSMTNPKTAGVAVSESSLRRLAGSYLLYERILARFEVSRGRLVRVDEPGRRALVPRSETGFSDGARRYLFVLDSGGKPQGVRIVDPEYDPSIAENSVLYLAANLTTLDAPRAPKPEWSRFTGRYAGTFIGQSVEVRVSLRDGYLMIDDTLRIFDESDGTFATADGERVELDGTRLSIGNRLYHR